jgi:molecular chaperone DnaJ
MGFMGDHQTQDTSTAYQNMSGEEFSEFMKGFGGFKDIFSEFENMMSGGSSTRSKYGANMPRRGRNIQMSMDLTFEEAAKGVKKTINFAANVACKTCKGTGARPGTKPITCTTCSGTGTESTRSGLFSFSRPCRSCGGSGTLILAKCTTCQGTGKVQDRRSLKVEIPAGVDSGMSIRFSDQGEPGEFGGSPGYLFIVVNVMPSQIFRRDGSDIHVDVPISFTEAMLGAKVKVPTLDGDVEVTIPAGTQPGDHVKLAYKGIKLPGASFHGHQYVNFNVYLPTQLTSRQKELLEEFSQLEHKASTATGKSEPRRSFFDRLRHRFQQSDGRTYEGDNDANTQNPEAKEKTG